MTVYQRNDYSIIIGVKDIELAEPVNNSLKPLNTYTLIGKDYPSFSKLVNRAILECKTDIVIFCSHRVRPTPDDIQKLLNKIDEGHGLVGMYRLACFGFKKELIKRIGFFDERFSIGGWEDNDFFMRLQEADISYYEEESVEYIKGKSLWIHPENKPKESEVHFYNKWILDKNLNIISRKMPEITHYDIGESDKGITFKKWSDSVLTTFSMWQKIYSMVDYSKYIQNKKILIFGGTGSLGKKLVDIYGNKNDIYIFSRDENKHWSMSLDYKKLKFTLGDIRDQKSVKESILQIQPDIIIIASALKHIDKCEYEVNQSYMTNCMGVMNVLDTVKEHYNTLCNLSSVVFISTDKACSPINTYGMTKALAEKVVVEIAYKMQNLSSIKFLSVRYGNVLNSRGSIIEAMDKIGKSIMPNYKLHNPNMTRFIMTQEQSVRLIDYAIREGESGDIVIPKISAMSIKDMIELYAEKYNKTIVEGELRPGEKIHEELLNSFDSRTTVERQFYYIIKPAYKKDKFNDFVYKYSSNYHVITKDNLYNYLEDLKLI